jgi:hypothetical protein
MTTTRVGRLTLADQLGRIPPHLPYGAVKRHDEPPEDGERPAQHGQRKLNP